MKKISYTFFMIIFLVLHMVLVSFTLAFAFLGTYEAGAPANIWSIIWSKGIVLDQILIGIISIVLGIVGIVKSKGNKVQFAVAVALLASIFVGILSVVYAIGSHF